MVIGITGSSGAGKSTVCEILESKYGFKIINADKIAKRLSQKGTEYLADIVKQFGTEILLEDGELDRSKLAEIIYNNQEKREKLNEITFKYIREEIQKEIKSVKEVNDSMQIAIDAPLLFEAKLEEFCNFVIAIISENRELQIKRIIQRDLVKREQAVARLNAQKPNEYYISKSKYVIINNGLLEEIEKQVEEKMKIF